jgi:iron complex transport system substrate-binding protein
MRRSLRLLSVLLVLLLGAAACGDDDSSSEPDRETTDDAASEDAYPVTITHAHGETVLDAKPERIVTLNVQWTDAVLAMGVKPVAYGLDAGSLETEPYPWQTDAVEGVTRLDFSGTPPYEQIAALEPDLILTTYVGIEQPVYETLSGIAPTIGLLGDLDVDPWQDMLRVMGEVLGDTDKADDVIAGVEGEIDALADELPGLEGKTYVMANYVEGDSIYVVADPNDGASGLFYALGMAIDPDILALDPGAVGRVQLSLEQAGLLDADLLAILTQGADPSRLPGWDQLTAVQQGTVIDFEFADVVGLNTPSALSLPYVIDIMRPTFVKLAG